MEGFLGSHAGYRSDLNLTIQVLMGVALIFGAFLARAKRFVAHGICQTAVLALNLALICFWMWPSFPTRTCCRVFRSVLENDFTLSRRSMGS